MIAATVLSPLPIVKDLLLEDQIIERAPAAWGGHVIAQHSDGAFWYRTKSVYAHTCDRPEILEIQIIGITEAGLRDLEDDLQAMVAKDDEEAGAV